jgi:hypothetical protein
MSRRVETPPIDYTEPSESGSYLEDHKGKQSKLDVFTINDAKTVSGNL